MSLPSLPLLLTLLFLGASDSSLAQTHPIPLQRIHFTDSLVENRLVEFTRVSKDKFIHVSVDLDTTDGEYIYSVFPMRFYEMVEPFNSPQWGQWTNHILLFYGNADLRAIFRYASKAALDQGLSWVGGRR